MCNSANPSKLCSNYFLKLNFWIFVNQANIRVYRMFVSAVVELFSPFTHRWWLGGYGNNLWHHQLLLTMHNFDGTRFQQLYSWYRYTILLLTDRCNVWCTFWLVSFNWTRIFGELKSYHYIDQKYIVRHRTTWSITMAPQ